MERNQWQLTELTADEAERFTRRAYNVPAGVGLGWVPYRFYLTRGAVAQAACHTEAECARMLTSRGLTPTPWSAWDSGVRTMLPAAENGR